MATSVTEPDVRTPRELLETPARTMAKADLKKVDAADFRKRIGLGLVRMRQLAGLSQKETAALIDRDVAQLARWEAGTERPQFDALIAVEVLRLPLLLAFAERAGVGVEIETSIRIRRTA
jgi:DNA-binding transcriptional regulator YiaG